MESKICSACGETKALDEFHRTRNQCKVCKAEYNAKYNQNYKEVRRRKYKQYYEDNKEKLNQKSADYHANNRDRKVKYHQDNRERIANNNLKRKYGLTPDNVQVMLEEQDNCCKICDIRFDVLIRHNVDHCHVTNKIRGLVCRNCNWGLGNFKDNPDTLKRAITYLEESNEVSNSE